MSDEKRWSSNKVSLSDYDALLEHNQKLEDRNDMLSKNMYQLAKNSTVKISELEEEKKSYKDKYEFLMKQSTDSPYKGLLERNIKEYNQLKQELAELKEEITEINRFSDKQSAQYHVTNAKLDAAVKERDEAKIAGDAKARLGNDARAALVHALESVKMAEQMFESIVARSHSWVITRENGVIEGPIHDSYRQLAKDAQAKLKERHGL